MQNIQKVVLKGEPVQRLSYFKVSNQLFELGFMTTFGKPYQNDLIRQTNYPQSRELELSFLMMSGDYHI